MPEFVADPPSSSWYHLFPGIGIHESQRLSPDPFRLAPATRAGGGSEQAGRANMVVRSHNQYVSLAANLLQMQQAVIDDSI